MAEAVPASEAPRASRLDRRKARTRQALIDAAARLIAEGRGDRASIAEITEEADIGFGSFYNHFDSKEPDCIVPPERLLPPRACTAPHVMGYRNSPEMRLTEPATMTTPNT